MFINKAISWFQNTKTAAFLSDSLIFENIDNISFLLLCLTIISTVFMSSSFIGLFAVSFILSCVFKVFVKRGESAELSFLNKILIIYLLFVVISAFGASYFMLSLKGIMKTFIYISFYFAAVYFLSENKKKIVPVLLLIFGATFFEAIVGIMQNMSHVDEIAGWQDTSNLQDPTRAISRAYGTLKPYNPNLLAGYLLAGLSSIFSLAAFSYLKGSKKRLIFYSIAFLTVFYAIFITGSRGAYLGLFGFLGVIILYAFYIVKNLYGGFAQIKTAHKALFGGIMAFVVGLLCFVPSLSSRILSIFSFRKDSSISFRMNVYEACYQMFSDNKFLGIGVGNKNFREIYGLYMKTGYDALGAYSVPLEIAVESGVFAFIAFFTYIILIVLRCVRYTLFVRSSIYKKVLIFSVLLTLTGTMFHGFFDTIFFRPQVQVIFWLNMALFHAVTIKRKKLKRIRLSY